MTEPLQLKIVIRQDIPCGAGLRVQLRKQQKI